MQERTHDIKVFIFLATALILIMGAFIVTMLFLYKRKQLAHIRDLERMKMEFEKDTLKTELEIQEQSFLMISREIHDNINLSLTLAKLNLNATYEAFNKQEINPLTEPIRLISKVISELTELSRAINSDVIKECGLITALNFEIERIKKLTNPVIHYNLSGNPVYMDSQRELFIFRIIQETFNNILKHSKAKNIFIQLNYDSSELKIDIRDDGEGFKKNQLRKIKGIFPSSGLKNIQKRTELLRGEFKLLSEPGMGTQLFLNLPIKVNDA